MDAEAKEVLDKLYKVIDTAELHQKPIVERYTSLANRRLHRIIVSRNVDVLGIARAHTGMVKKISEKFGQFTPRPEAIQI